MIVLALLLLLSPAEIQCARILASFITPSYSHQIVYQPIWRELALRGHEVVVITPNPLRENITTLREIDVGAESYEVWNRLLTKRHHNKQLAIIQTLHSATRIQLGHPEVQAMVNNKSEHFDLVIVEWIHLGMGILSGRFKCPLVGISSIGSFFHTNIHSGNPIHPILYPDFLQPYSGDMNLLQRASNALSSIGWRLLYYSYILPYKNKEAHEFVKDAPPLEEVLENVSMVFFYVNKVLSAKRPNVPAVIEFSGTNIHKPRKLPKDIQEFLDSADEGAIYLSFGTNIRSNMLPQETITTILQVLGELPYKTIWKFELDLQDVPKNIKIVKWAPQQDILAHPKTRLFIMQGGIQSMEEAIRNKVPLLGMPFYADQYMNVHRMVELGLGASIGRDAIVELKQKILQVITDEKYKRRMEEASQIMGDEPENSLDKVVWWIEYVIRHKGARHLRTSYGQIEWYKFLMIDVFAFLTLLVCCGLYLGYRFWKFVSHACCAKNKTKTS